MKDSFDAHVHTHYSDAAPEQSPEEVCRAAKEAGVEHLCITDHDRILPETRRQELCRTYDLDVIPGCEFSGEITLSSGRQVTAHVLGMWLPRENPPLFLGAVLAWNQNQDFLGYSKAMLQKLLDLGIDPSGEGVNASFRMLRELNPHTRHWGKNAVAHLLVKTGYADSPQQAKDRWLSAFGQGLAYVPADRYCRYMSLKDAMIAACTGLSVLCHLYYYQLTLSEQEELIRRFKRMGGQALEVDYGGYSPEQQAELMGYCKKYDLLPVASSDRHEANEPFKLGDPAWFEALRDRCRQLHGRPASGEGPGEA